MASLLRWLDGIWRWLSDLGSVLKPCRFSVLGILAGFVTLAFVPQGQDVLRRLAEGHGSQWGITLLFAVAAAIVWAVSCWYWGRFMVQLKLPTSPADTPRLRKLRTHVPRVLGALALMGVALAHFLAALSYRHEYTSREPVVRLTILGALYLLLAVILHLAVSMRRELLRSLGRRLARAEGGSQARVVQGLLGVPDAGEQFTEFRQMRLGTRLVAWASLVLSIVAFIAFTWFPVSLGQLAGTAAIFLIAVANGVFFGSILVAFGSKHRFPIISLLFLCAFLFGFWNDNHIVRLASGVLVEGDRPTVAERLKDWVKERRGEKPEGRIPLFLVSAAGGGARAAYWTGAVLGRLQDTNPCFARHIFAISSVSGGSLGAGVFTALLADQAPPAAPLDPCRPATGERRLAVPTMEILAQDFLSPVIAKMVAPDLLQRFLPLAVRPFDRSLGLEEAWEKNPPGSRRFRGPFLDLWKSDPLGVPALVLNSTHVETGRRVLTSSMRLGGPPPDAILDTVDLLSEIGRDLPLSAAVHNSARFSYVSPAGTVHDKAGQRAHLVDGGYFENSGAATAGGILALIQQSGLHADIDPHVIYIDNQPTGAGAPTGLASRSKANTQLLEWFAPLYALLETREARGALAVAELRSAVPPGHFLEFGLCERNRRGEGRVPLPLGWELSEDARSSMDWQLDHACEAFHNPATLDDVMRALK